ncbi:MAG: 50S ribosomal protein L15 [Calditrichia bacterium]
MDLSNLKPAEGATKKKKRIGRGVGSGHGKTATKGHKGQKSRSGAKHRAWFEGGQMPVQRRLPKFGFTNIFKKQYQTVNVEKLEILATDKKITEVTPEVLKENGLIRSDKGLIKILGNGNLSKKINVSAHAFSKSAQEKIEKAGGKIVQL